MSTILGILVWISGAWAVPGGRLYHCDETSVVRAIYQQAIDFRVDAHDRPTHVQVSRLVWPGPEIRAYLPAYLPSYSGGYWLNNYGLEAWYLGAANQSQYALMLPTGGLGGQFDAELHQVFVAGGWWQSQFSCRVQ